MRHAGLSTWGVADHQERSSLAAGSCNDADWSDEEVCACVCERERKREGWARGTRAFHYLPTHHITFLLIITFVLIPLPSYSFHYLRTHSITFVLIQAFSL